MSDTTGQIYPACPYCGNTLHVGKCPMVSAFEYHPDGKLKRVEFHGPSPAIPNIIGPYYSPEPFPKPDPIKGWEVT